MIIVVPEMKPMNGVSNITTNAMQTQQPTKEATA